MNILEDLEHEIKTSFPFAETNLSNSRLTSYRSLEIRIEKQLFLVESFAEIKFWLSVVRDLDGPPDFLFSSFAECKKELFKLIRRVEGSKDEK